MNQGAPLYSSLDTIMNCCLRGGILLWVIWMHVGGAVDDSTRVMCDTCGLYRRYMTRYSFFHAWQPSGGSRQAGVGKLTSDLIMNAQAE